MERRPFFSTIAARACGFAVPPSPLKPTHSDFGVMLADIRAWVASHPGAVVLCADVPGQMLIGYTAFVVSDGVSDESCSLYTIPISAIKESRVPEHRELVRSFADRRSLALRLSTGAL